MKKDYNLQLETLMAMRLSMYLAGNLEIRKTDKVVKCLAGNIQLYIENFGELIKILGIDNDSHIASIRDMFKKYSLDELEQMYTKEQIITKFLYLYMVFVRCQHITSIEFYMRFICCFIIKTELQLCLIVSINNIGDIMDESQRFYKDHIT